MTLPAPPGVEVPVRWLPGAHTRRLVTLAAAAFTVPLLGSTPRLAALAVPLVVWLAVTTATAPRPGPLRLTGPAGAASVAEGEPIEVTLRLAGAGGAARAVLAAADGIEVLDAPTTQTLAGDGWVEFTWRLVPHRWGLRAAGTVTVSVDTGAWAGRVQYVLPTLTVLPAPAATAATFVPDRLLARLGEHLARRSGSGSEFHGVRSWAVGDQARQINWRVTARRPGTPWVNQRAAENAADLVVVLDAVHDIRDTHGSSLDLGVRAAAGLARSHLAAGDRVGIVAVGTTIRWLPPALGTATYRHIAQAALEVTAGQDDLAADLDRLPPVAVPTGAAVVLVSPLTEPRMVTLAASLAGRGHTVAVVDVLTGEPAPRPPRGRLRRADAELPTAALARRLWRLDRDAVRFRLADRGIPVLAWAGDNTLPAATLPGGAR